MVEEPPIQINCGDNTGAKAGVFTTVIVVCAELVQDKAEVAITVNSVVALGKTPTPFAKLGTTGVENQAYEVALPTPVKVQELPEHNDAVLATAVTNGKG